MESIFLSLKKYENPTLQRARCESSKFHRYRQTISGYCFPTDSNLCNTFLSVFLNILLFPRHCLILSPTFLIYFCHCPLSSRCYPSKLRSLVVKLQKKIAAKLIINLKLRPLAETKVQTFQCTAPFPN